MRKNRRRQDEKPAQPEPSAQVVGLWREILLEEPDTCPWKFACAMAKGGHIDGAEVWQTAEWADSVRENVRQLRLKQIVSDIQEITRQLA